MCPDSLAMTLRSGRQQVCCLVDSSSLEAGHACSSRGTGLWVRAWRMARGVGSPVQSNTPRATGKELVSYNLTVLTLFTFCRRQIPSLQPGDMRSSPDCTSRVCMRSSVDPFTSTRKPLTSFLSSQPQQRVGHYTTMSSPQLYIPSPNQAPRVVLSIA